MISDFDDGRSKSFYCIAATLLPTVDLEVSLNKAEEKMKLEKIREDDVKAKSKIFKEILNEVAEREGTELKLRKKAKS
ncbi:MAG: hypothetical protein FJ045_03360 [Crenarchaeota archaeon]|nr:hypothetical protein [Thermoproteota archaeon]